MLIREISFDSSAEISLHLQSPYFSPISFFPIHNRFICRSEAKAWYLKLSPPITPVAEGLGSESEFGKEAGLEIRNKICDIENLILISNKRLM